MLGTLDGCGKRGWPSSLTPPSAPLAVLHPSAANGSSPRLTGWSPFCPAGRHNDRFIDDIRIPTRHRLLEPLSRGILPVLESVAKAVALVRTTVRCGSLYRSIF